MKPKLWINIFFLLMLVAGCGGPTQESLAMDIFVSVPDCTLQPSQRIVVSLRVNNLPNEAEIDWQVDSGKIEFPDPNDEISLYYTAPNSPGDVTLRVKVKTNSGITTVEKHCTVAYPIIISTPTEISPTPNIDPTITGTPTVTVTPTPCKDCSTISITEIMGSPCNDDKTAYANEYVELYNFGDRAIDVSGWFITTTGQVGDSDEITKWSDRSGDKFGEELILNSTVIEPHHFGVIISPMYTLVKSDHSMPYFFPEGTVILTVKRGDRIGNKGRGFYTDAQPYDAFLLYIGSIREIKDVMSTYGLHGEDISDLESITSHRVLGLPLHTPKCQAVQRKMADGNDTLGNWELIKIGGPGCGPY